jgi:ketosteroid isomerase-like protein
MNINFTFFISKTWQVFETCQVYQGWHMKIFLLFGLILMFSCKDSMDEKVEDAMDKYDNLILHTDAKGISEMFMADGEMAPPGMNPIRGRDSIEHFLSAFKGIKVEEQKSTTDSIRRFGNTAIQYGKYYQRAEVNNTKAEVHGMFQANWVIQPDGKLLLKRMSAWVTGNK